MNDNVILAKYHQHRNELLYRVEDGVWTAVAGEAVALPRAEAEKIIDQQKCSTYRFGIACGLQVVCKHNQASVYGWLSFSDGKYRLEKSEAPLLLWLSADAVRVKDNYLKSLASDCCMNPNDLDVLAVTG